MTLKGSDPWKALRYLANLEFQTDVGRVNVLGGLIVALLIFAIATESIVGKAVRFVGALLGSSTSPIEPFPHGYEVLLILGLLIYFGISTIVSSRYGRSKPTTRRTSRARAHD